MVLGVLLGVAGGALFVRSAGASVIETFTTPVRVTPADLTLDLDEGTYVIYEATSPATGDGFGTTSGRSVSISPSDVSVVNASGEQLVVEAESVTETIDRDNLTFTGAVRFTVDSAGPHRVEVAGSDQQFIVAPSLFSSFGRVIAWLGLIAVGALLGLIGLVLLIAGLIRGSKSGKPTVAPPIVPVPPPIVPAPVETPVVPAPVRLVQPGWYDDPRGEARLRWWDGQQWTEHASL